jgi:rhodanese-related sulfurtransferase
LPYFEPSDAAARLNVVHSHTEIEVSAVGARELLQSGALLIDVREDHEWVAGHAPEAIHTPMSRFAEFVDDLPTDNTIVCVCHVGGRSAMIADALNRSGWSALNLTGGMEAWLAAELPIVDNAGQPGTVV